MASESYSQTDQKQKDVSTRSVVFAAFGTLGDVLPLARLAVRLTAHDDELQVHFAAPLDLQETLRSALEYDCRLANHPSPSRVTWVWIDVPTIVSRSLATAEDSAVFESLYNRKDEFCKLESMISTNQPALVVFNLFCLEAWHVGFANDCETVGCHPYLIPQGPSEDDRKQLLQQSPQLSASLTRNIEDCVTLAEFNFWMWPLLNSERWEQMWLHYLTPKFGKVAPWECYALPRTNLIICGDPTLTLREGHWPSSVQVLPFPRLHEETTMESQHFRVENSGSKSNRPFCVSLGASAKSLSDDELLYRLIVIAVALHELGSWSFWLCGTDSHEFNVWKSCLSYAAVAGFLTQEFSNGCIEGYRKAPDNVSNFLSTLGSMQEQILETSRSFNLSENLSKKPVGVLLIERIVPVPFYLPLEKLLPRCALLVHHGGSGTSITATALGIKQVIIPSFFDQHWWGARLENLGLAVQLSKDAIKPNPNISQIDLTSALLMFQFSCIRNQSSKLSNAMNRALECSNEECMEVADTLSRNVAQTTVSKLYELSSSPRKLEIPACCRRKAPAKPKTTVCCCSANNCCARYQSSRAIMSVEDLISLSPNVSLCRSTHLCSEESKRESGEIIEEVYKDSVYYPKEVEHLQLFKNSSLNVVDIGSNIGVFISWVNSWRLESARTQYVAVEPVDENFRFLQANMYLHGIESTNMNDQSIQLAERNTCAYLYNSLVCEEEGKYETVRHYLSVPGNSTRYPELREKSIEGQSEVFRKYKDINCRTVTLPSILDTFHREPVDILKIDVEGSELSILKAMTDHDFALIRYLTMEVHPPWENIRATIEYVAAQHVFDEILLKRDARGCTHSETLSLGPEAIMEGELENYHSTCRMCEQSNWYLYAWIRH